MMSSKFFMLLRDLSKSVIMPSLVVIGQQLEEKHVCVCGGGGGGGGGVSNIFFMKIAQPA